MLGPFVFPDNSQNSIFVEMKREEIITILKNKKPLLESFGISELGLFGSFLENKATAQSDIDILVHFYPEKETFDNLMKTYDFLEKLFEGKKIDLVTKNGLSPFIGKHILNQAYYV